MEVENAALADASKVVDNRHKNYEFTSVDQNMLTVEQEVGGQTNTGGALNQDSSYLSGGLAGSLTEKIGSFNPVTAAVNEKPLNTDF